MEFFGEAWRLATAAAAVICIIPAFVARQRWIKIATAALAALFTLASAYLIAMTGRGMEETIVCGIAKNAPGCVQPATAAQPQLSPCQQVASLGFECSGAGLLRAVESNNREAIEAFLRADIDGNTIVNSEWNGALPVWFRAGIAETTTGLEHLLAEMNKRNTEPEPFEKMFDYVAGYYPQIEEPSMCVIRRFAPAGERNMRQRLQEHDNRTLERLRDDWRDARSSEGQARLESLRGYRRAGIWNEGLAWELRRLEETLAEPDINAFARAKLADGRGWTDDHYRQFVESCPR